MARYSNRIQIRLRERKLQGLWVQIIWVFSEQNGQVLFFKSGRGNMNYKKIILNYELCVELEGTK